jgi:hypothetical protein
MHKGIGIALLVVGIILIVYGLKASDSVGSDVSRAVTGTPTDKSMWLLLGGVGATIVGGVTTVRGSWKA